MATAEESIAAIDRMDAAIRSLGQSFSLSEKEIEGLISRASGFVAGAIEEWRKIEHEITEEAFHHAIEAALGVVTEECKQRGYTVNNVDGSTQHG